MKEKKLKVKDIDEVHPLYELMNFGNKPRRLCIMAAYPGDFWQISHKLRENDIIKVYFDGVYKRPIIFKRDAYLEMAKKHNLRLIRSKKPTITFNPNYNVIMDEFLEQKINIGILDKSEKEYLSAVIKPFRDRVCYIRKERGDNIHVQYISIKSKRYDYDEDYVDEDDVYEYVALPYFEKDTMYAGMLPLKKYTLKELGL